MTPNEIMSDIEAMLKEGGGTDNALVISYRAETEKFTATRVSNDPNTPDRVEMRTVKAALAKVLERWADK